MSIVGYGRNLLQLVDKKCIGNGQVEKYNHTLMNILRKVAEAEPDRWDELLPATLFAYSEVPAASTGMAPATLLFGRSIAGPLAALRKSWTDEKASEDVCESSKSRHSRKR